jgi:hypothetical protein
MPEFVSCLAACKVERTSALQASRASLWGGAVALAVATGPATEDLRYLKSSALQMWLLG